jgi:hypothetical protein
MRFHVVVVQQRLLPLTTMRQSLATFTLSKLNCWRTAAIMPRRSSTGRRFTRFRLSTIFVLTALIAAALAYFTRPEQKEASGLIGIRRPLKALLEPNADAIEIGIEFQRFREFQAHLVQSPLVLSKVIVDPKIAGLPIVKAQKDPEKFVSERLDVSFPAEEYMLVKMAGRKDEIDQLRQVLDAILVTYVDMIEDVRRQNRATWMKVLEIQTERLEREIHDVNTTLEQHRELVSKSAGPRFQLDFELTQADLDRRKWLHDELARRRLILNAELHNEPTVYIFTRATVHSPSGP